MTLDIKKLNCVAHYKPSYTEVYLEEKIKHYNHWIGPEDDRYLIEFKRPYLEIDPDVPDRGHISRKFTFNLHPQREIVYTRRVSIENLDSLYTCLNHPRGTSENIGLKCGDEGTFGISFRICGKYIYNVTTYGADQHTTSQFLEWIYNHGFYWGRGIRKLINKPTSKQIVAHIVKRMSNKEAVKCVLRAGRKFHRFIEEK